jgi:hypothetical protein
MLLAEWYVPPEPARGSTRCGCHLLYLPPDAGVPALWREIAPKPALQAAPGCAVDQ